MGHERWRPSSHQRVVARWEYAFVVLRLVQMTGSLWRSAFVSVLFAVHPLHVESVAWIAERKDVLSTFFGLFALWAYSDTPDTAACRNICS